MKSSCSCFNKFIMDNGGSTKKNDSFKKQYLQIPEFQMPNTTLVTDVCAQVLYSIKHK